ncbi:MAG: 23S rRNA (pseudouridine(1915)-N(3))-methyltransferase RlmH [Bryobacterales bacterium]|nr:23S rRNA (pseudouridine(1915)-N(3))-methyltransferase RlmH [Bryobacterales bacterium]
MRIVLYYYGRIRDRHAQAICEEYLKRSQRYIRFELQQLKPHSETWDQPGTLKFLLSPEGEMLSSAQFAQVIREAQAAARDLHLVIGPTDGHPASWKQRADRLMSLSAMTFPHELARAMLCEQVYRGVTLLAGHAYPR